MFRGHWLVADLDGTLTPTPSKAGGSYYSLAQCARVFGASYVSCLPALRSFVAHGGSLCVVSTAGRRLWSQVYNDLADTLYPRLADVGRGHTPHNSNNNNDSDKTNDDDDATTGTSTLPGRLLLCGFTGAALFRSRAPASVWRDMQTHHHHDTRHDDDVTPTTTTTTTNDARTTPPAAVGLEEWLAYRRCAAAPPHDNGHSNTTTASSSPATTMSDAVQRCAAEEGRAALVRFLEHASCVSGHDVARARVFFRGCLSRKYHDAFADLLAMVLQEVRATTTATTTTATATTRAGDDNVAPLCFAHTTPLAMTALATHGRYLRETNDALVDCQAVPRADGSVAADAPIAQVVIMGIPAAYYTRVFVDNDNDNDNSSHALQCCAVCAQRGRGALARLRACGLTVKSQPNSVCVHRTGVDKGTCVRWLCAHASTSAATASDDDAAAAAAAMTTSSSTNARAHTDKTDNNKDNDEDDNNNEDDDDDTLDFALARAIAFGDVPATVDRPLALAPPMTFVSLSLAEDDGLSSLSVAADDASTTTTSDDVTLRDNVVHVGGEEEGTALFLQELLEDCAAEAAAAAASASPVAANAAATAATTQTLFTRARVEACAARARARLRDVQRARAEAAAVSLSLPS